MGEVNVTQYVVAGHFGSMLSYATITKEVCKGLARRGMLAGTINFDDKYLGFEHVRVTQEAMDNARLLAITLPSHHISQLAEHFGSHRSVLYMSPNTDTLSDDANRASWSFGGIVTPSQFCEDTVLRATGKLSGRVPLGVGEPLVAAHESVTQALRARLDAPPRFLHMSTDGFLPGRKGTETLITAIAMARDALPPGTRFTFHVLPSVQFVIRSICEEQHIEDLVTVVPGNKRGVSDEELAELIGDHDVVVQPSRCEGYGITQLLPLTMGVPLLTTCSTGMAEFLYQFRGCWMPIRHCQMSKLEGEEGLCPDVAPGEISALLPLVASRTMRESALTYQSMISREKRASWLWSACADRWIDAIEESFQHG